MKMIMSEILRSQSGFVTFCITALESEMINILETGEVEFLNAFESKKFSNELG